MSDQAEPLEPIPCPPCSGTGKVKSNLGGSLNEIDCPWCEGAGVFNAEHNAQAHWAPDEPGAPQAST